MFVVEKRKNIHISPLCSSVGRTLEEFKTSVTVAAHKKVTFELTYEELLKRRLGLYELQIHARPMQPVKDFKVRPSRKPTRGRRVGASHFLVIPNSRWMCTLRRKLASLPGWLKEV